MLPPAPQPRRVRVRRIAALVLLLSAAAASAAASDVASAPPSAKRIVSLNPSLTAILVALGAAGLLVGVDDYSAEMTPEVAHLPRVGGLYSPSLEAVVALTPDIVVLVPSAEQRDFRERVESFGVRVAVFDNIRFDQVLENIERLGALSDQRAAARRRIEAIERTRAAAVVVTSGRAQPRVLVVLQHDPIFVVGSGSFMSDMLDRLGSNNLGAEFADPYPRVDVEWVVAKGPEVLIDLSPDADGARAYWERWPSIPAVEDDRVLELPAALVSMPGPWLDRALLVLAAGLYGDEAAEQIRREQAP